MRDSSFDFHGGGKESDHGNEILLRGLVLMVFKPSSSKSIVRLLGRMFGEL
ncbi:uncharacterized protein DS421_6g180360 [Arachis hypogaea]|nr:uncharacterized protein DS421_6g180360 [Arachis hypogaea]